MQRTTRRPTNLQEFNREFPPQQLVGQNATGADCARPRTRVLTHTSTIHDWQFLLSNLSDQDLGNDTQLLLAMARDLPVTLKHEPGLMSLCASRCLQAASQAPLATQEHVWLTLRNALPRLPQATALALRDCLDSQAHHMPATVV